MLAAVDLVARDLGRLEVVDQQPEQLPRLGGIVAAVVADVDVEGEPLALGPGVDRKVGLGEHHGAGEAGAFELVEGRIHGGQARGFHHRNALCAKARAVEKALRIAAAAGEVTDEMQTVHFFYAPQNAKAQPAEKETRLRLPSAPTGAKQRSSIVFNSFKTSQVLR